jgi:hypothetical protein
MEHKSCVSTIEPYVSKKTCNVSCLQETLTVLYNTEEQICVMFKKKFSCHFRYSLYSK